MWCRLEHHFAWFARWCASDVVLFLFLSMSHHNRHPALIISADNKWILLAWFISIARLLPLGQLASLSPSSLSSAYHKNNRANKTSTMATQWKPSLASATSSSRHRALNLLSASLAHRGRRSSINQHCRRVLYLAACCCCCSCRLFIFLLSINQQANQIQKESSGRGLRQDKAHLAIHLDGSDCSLGVFIVN